MSISEILGALFTSDGPGGIIVIFVVGLAALVYFWITRWIIQGEEYDRQKERKPFQ